MQHSVLVFTFTFYIVLYYIVQCNNIIYNTIYYNIHKYVIYSYRYVLVCVLLCLQGEKSSVHTLFVLLSLSLNSLTLALRHKSGEYLGNKKQGECHGDGHVGVRKGEQQHPIRVE